MNCIKFSFLLLTTTSIGSSAWAAKPIEHPIETIPISQTLIDRVKTKQVNTYVVYTFDGPTPYAEPHRQYWRGLIGMDEIEISKAIDVGIDEFGSMQIPWHQTPYRNSYMTERINKAGSVVERWSINPDGSFNIAVDLDNDSIVDYLDVLTPDHGHIVIVSDPHGLAFLDRILEGLNPYCAFNDVFGVETELLPGCSNNETDSKGGTLENSHHLGGSKNPADQAMATLCAGYKVSGADGLRVGTHMFEGRTNHPIPEGGYQSVNSYIDPDNPNVKHIETVNFNADGSRANSVSETITFDDEGNVIERQINRTNEAGQTSRMNVTYRPDGSYTTHSIAPDGGYVITDVGPDGVIYDQVTGNLNDADSGHPGWEQDSSSGMAMFCAIWSESKKNRPNDVEELNKRANEERCNIKPNETGENDDASLSKTCFLDVDGAIEVERIVNAGRCVTFSGGTHFDYQSNENCSSNNTRVLELGNISNGAAGLTAFECDSLVCRGPED